MLDLSSTTFRCVSSFQLSMDIWPDHFDLVLSSEDLLLVNRRRSANERNFWKLFLDDGENIDLMSPASCSRPNWCTGEVWWKMRGDGFFGIPRPGGVSKYTGAQSKFDSG